MQLFTGTCIFRILRRTAERNQLPVEVKATAPVYESRGEGVKWIGALCRCMAASDR